VKVKLPDFAGWKISAILKRLKNLGLIKRIKKSYRYVVTQTGKKVFSTGLYLKNQIIIPALANA
jgi:chromosome segregation and condensation protein ScpB